MNDKEIIFQFLSKLAEEVKARIPSSSGATAAGIEVTAEAESGKILAPRYIQVLEDGRKPTREGATKGNPTLRESIELWLTTKGITATGISIESLAFLIARKIHNEGNRLYRAGGKSGVLSNVFTESRINAFTETITGRYQAIIKSDVIKAYQL